MVEQVKWVDEIITGEGGAGAAVGGNLAVKQQQQQHTQPAAMPTTSRVWERRQPRVHSPPTPTHQHTHPQPPPPQKKPRRPLRPEPRVHQRALQQAQDRLHHPRGRPLPAAGRHRRVRARQEAGAVQAGGSAARPLPGCTVVFPAWLAGAILGVVDEQKIGCRFGCSSTRRLTRPPRLAPRRPPRQIKRTEGVSTTDIVGRMLTCTRPASFREHEEKVGGPWSPSIVYCNGPLQLPDQPPLQSKATS
jgi:hypothetical protein